ncbi:MAG: hypothetical protein PWQ68_1035 [Thermoanaerobacteraceae bacterium]|jgi:CO/xanthine dehydrogenase Mo-binding subunit|nr:hypothetical protein [Thermoanaerobacteraceae bacterium]
MNESYIGKSIPRIESVDKVTGSARYVHDMKLPGMLYARILTSPHAHAKICSIDTSRAEKLPGVKAVLTGPELPYKLGLYLVDKDILAKDKVRYQGEAVAAVAAVSEEIAEEAVRLIKVEYEPLPAVFDPVEALKEDAPLVHEELGSYSFMKGVFNPRPNTNIANHFKLRKGDVEKGFQESYRIFENEFRMPQVQHVPMETHAVIAEWLPSGRINIYTSAQSPFTVRNLMSVAFNIPHSRIHVVIPYVGGGFGGKAGIHLEPLAATLSRKAGGRPVKLVATREEEFNTIPVRQGIIARIKTGVSAEGRILAEDITYYWDAGAYADYGVNIGRASGYSGAGPYDIDNVRIDSYTIYTNHPYGTAYRGFGHVEFFWAIERQIDIIAHEMGIDPYELRMKNLLKPGSITITGEKIRENTGRVDKCLEMVAKEIGWKGSKTEEERKKEFVTGRVKGKGIAVLHKAPAMPTFTSSSAIIKFNEDGSVDVLTSGTDYGQGTYTALAQIAAEVLKMPLEKVHVVWENDTDTGPYDWQTVASRYTFMGGNAVIKAARDLIEQMKKVASAVLRAPEDELEIDNEKVYIKHNPDEYVTYQQLAMGYVYPNGNAIGGPLIGRGSYIAQGLTNLDPETGQGLPAIDWTYGAHGIEIEVDVRTGEIHVKKVVSAFDVGRVINRILCEGQITGGVIQGLGTALLEGYVYNKDGKLLNNSFTDYKIPTAKDIPETLIPLFVETPQLDGPFGARGVAEHPMISVPSALGNALYDALGIDIKELPITSEQVWKKIKNKITKT